MASGFDNMDRLSNALMNVQISPFEPSAKHLRLLTGKSITFQKKISPQNIFIIVPLDLNRAQVRAGTSTSLLKSMRSIVWHKLGTTWHNHNILIDK